MMKRLAVVLASTGLLALIPGRAAAQGLYEVITNSDPAPTYTNWTPFSFGGAGNASEYRDTGVAHLDFPADGFKFKLYDQEYSSFDITPDGVLLFENVDGNGKRFCNGSNSNCYNRPPGSSIPSNATNTPHALVAFWWGDMKVGTTGASEYTVVGTTPPNRIFSVQLTGWGQFKDQNEPIAPRTVQVDLHENSSVVDVYYGAIATAADSPSSTKAAVVGVENRTGSMGTIALSCAGTAAKCLNADWPAGTHIRMMLTSKPDLTPKSFAASAMTPTTVNGKPGYAVDLTTTIANQGPGPANQFKYKVYRTTSSTTINPATDTCIFTSAPQDLPGNTPNTYRDTITFERPATTGRFYLGVMVNPDRTIDEAIFTNNTLLTANPYLVGVDLTGSISGPTSATPGEEVKFTVVINNNGTDRIGPFGYQLYLSETATLGPTSVAFAKKGSVPNGLGGGEQYRPQGGVPFSLPKMPKDDRYFILMAIDSAGDDDPSNNFASSSPDKISVALAELACLDVQVTTPTQPYTPITSVYFGDQIRVVWTMKNDGNGAARDFLVAGFFTTSPMVSMGKQPVLESVECEHKLWSVEAKTTVNRECTFTVPSTNKQHPNRAEQSTPLEEGNYFVHIVLDPQHKIAEVGNNTANNTARYMTEIVARHPSMDAVAVSLEAPTVAAVGELMPVQRVVRNIGINSVPIEYRYVLSPNEFITRQDPALPLMVDGQPVLNGTVEIPVGEEKRAQEVVLVPPMTSPGTYYVGLVLDPDNKVKELDKRNNTVASVGTIEIVAARLRIETNSLPDALVGATYHQELVATGGNGTYDWSLVPGAGELPPGLTLSREGVISGRATDAVTAVFTVRVASGNHLAFERLVLRSIKAASPLQILTSQLLPATAMVSYSSQILAVGGVPPYTFALVEGALPGGLTLAADGKVSGTPATASETPLSFKVEVTDALGGRARAWVSIRVRQAESENSSMLLITTLKVADATVGESYMQMLQTKGGIGKLTWAVRKGALPDGLRLSESGNPGSIHGRPERVGIYSVLIEVSDESSQNTWQWYVIAVMPRTAAWNDAEVGPLPEARIGASYLFDLSPGAAARSRFVLSGGQLPPGVLLDLSGHLAGVVSDDAEIRSYDFIVELVEPAGATRLLPLTVRVVADEKPLVAPQRSGCSTTGGGVMPWFLAVALALPVLGRRACPGLRERRGVSGR